MRYFSGAICCARNITDMVSSSPLPTRQKGWSQNQASSAAVIPQRQTDGAEDTMDTSNSSSYQSSRWILWSLGYPTKTCEDSHFNEIRLWHDDGIVEPPNCWPSLLAKYLDHTRLLHICAEIKGDRIWEGSCRDEGHLNKGVLCGWQWQTFTLALGGRREWMRNSGQRHHWNKKIQQKWYQREWKTTAPWKNNLPRTVPWRIT